MGLGSGRRYAILLAIAALALGACSGGSATSAPSAGAPSAEAPSAAAPSEAAPSEAAAEPVEIEWWNLQVNDPGKSLLKDLADEYMAANPNVTIKETVLENEALKTKIATAMQAGTPPDVFQSWGGGGLAAQVEAGLVKDITTDIADWADTMNPGAMGIYQVDGKQYGVPYNFGMVGFWYNKALFEQAGITAPPTTWDELLADVKTLQDAGITPIALGAKDKWPSMFWWAYLAIRQGGQAALEAAIKDGAWDAPAFVEGGKALQSLIDLDPFQKGFLAATYPNESATMGNGKAAMELMGQWAPGAQAGESESKEGIGDDLAWFPFPALSGGAGAPTDAFGGTDGWALGKDAPPAAVDFVKFLSSVDVAKRWAALNDGTLPATNGAESAVTDPFLKTVLENRAKATFAQLYLDQVTSPELGAAINDAIAELFAGTASSEDVAKAITAAAQAQ
jgi:raffinose/stachyose/melibiose transport system substrate-binding protein